MTQNTSYLEKWKTNLKFAKKKMDKKKLDEFIYCIENLLNKSYLAPYQPYWTTEISFVITEESLKEYLKQTRYKDLPIDIGTQPLRDNATTLRLFNQYADI